MCVCVSVCMCVYLCLVCLCVCVCVCVCIVFVRVYVHVFVCVCINVLFIEVLHHYIFTQYFTSEYLSFNFHKFLLIKEINGVHIRYCINSFYNIINVAFLLSKALQQH